MTALTIIQQASSRMGLQEPQAVFGSTDPQAIQLRNLANQEVKELVRRCPWEALMTEQTFTTVAQAEQTNAVPSDFCYYLNDTLFDRTENRKLVGPLNSTEWQREKAGPVYTSVYHAFRFRGGELLVTPDPTAGNTVAYEYITKNAVKADDDTLKAEFTADTDTCRIAEELVTLGVIWRFKKAKGLDYSEEFRTYQMEVDQAAAQDKGSPTLNLGSSFLKRRFYPANIKEGSWP